MGELAEEAEASAQDAIEGHALTAPGKVQNAGACEKSPESEELFWRVAAGEAEEVSPDARLSSELSSSQACKFSEDSISNVLQEVETANKRAKVRGERDPNPRGDRDGANDGGGEQAGAHQRASGDSGGSGVGGCSSPKASFRSLPSVITWWGRRLDTPCALSCGLHEVRLKGKHGATVCLVGTAHVSKQVVT